MLCPKQTSYRKYQKGKSSIKTFSKLSDFLEFGRYGLKAKTPGILKANTIEAVRRVIVRKLKRKGQVWIRVFPDKCLSEKPLGTRMGKGKGNRSFWYVRVDPGQILFEIDGVSLKEAIEAFLKASKKLPVNTFFVKN